MNLLRQVNEALGNPGAPAPAPAPYELSEKERHFITEFAESYGSNLMGRFTDALINNGFDVDGDGESETEAATEAKLREMGLDPETREWDDAYDTVYGELWDERNGGPGMVGADSAKISAMAEARFQVLFQELRKHC